MSTVKPAELIRGNNDRVIGHACAVCGLLYTKKHYENTHEMATQCCVPRHCPLCQKEIPKNYKKCFSCIEQERLQKFQSKPEDPWDGEFPVCLFDDDRYFFSIDELIDYVSQLDDEEDFPEIEACVVSDNRLFCLAEHIEWESDRYGELPGEEELNNLVNNWITTKVPPRYIGNGQRITSQVKTLAAESS